MAVAYGEIIVDTSKLKAALASPEPVYRLALALQKLPDISARLRIQADEFVRVFEQFEPPEWWDWRCEDFDDGTRFGRWINRITEWGREQRRAMGGE